MSRATRIHGIEVLNTSDLSGASTTKKNTFLCLAYGERELVLLEMHVTLVGTHSYEIQFKHLWQKSSFQDFILHAHFLVADQQDHTGSAMNQYHASSGDDDESYSGAGTADPCRREPSSIESPSVVDHSMIESSCIDPNIAKSPFRFIALAFAKNRVSIYQQVRSPTPACAGDTMAIHLEPYHHVTCQERCLLFSARFYGTTLTTLRLACGTIFNEVLLWRPTVSALIQRRCQGHEVHK